MIDTNIIEQTSRTITEINPNVVAYSFKEWAGVIGMICTTASAAATHVYLLLKHAGGLRGIKVGILGPEVKIPVENTPKKSYIKNEPVSGGSSATLPPA